MALVGKVFGCLFVCLLLWLHLWHMEVPRPAVESELQLPAYTTATATWDPSCVCELHQIPDPPGEARDRILILVLMALSWICFCCAAMRTPSSANLNSGI